jgi:GT2 family glycosyltransferase
MILTVIIVNYNVKYFLEQCLHSVMKAAAGISHEILVVDNASTDGSREYLEKKFPHVSFTWNKENRGFAKANNQALTMASGDNILFLNPDTIIPEDCFQKCIDYLSKHRDTGALGVCMLDGSGRFLKESKRGFPTPLAAFCKLTGLSTLFPSSRIFSRYHMGHLDPMQNHETDVLAGAFMLVRHSVLKRTGGFDEAFFMYGEDIDLSYRIRQAGYKNIYFSECPILHFKGESTRKGSLNYVRLFYGAMSIFTRKHHGGLSAGIFSFGIHLAIWIKAFLSASGHFFLFIGRYILSWLPVHKKNGASTMVVGNREGFQRALAILDKNALLKILPLWVADSAGNEKSIGQPADLPKLVLKFRATEIIFCEGDLSYKDIIYFIQTLPGKLRIRISANTTQSIVGSDCSIGSG